ncbi:MAG: hypothetical protein AAF191_09440, partial [Verrucomicrobiota bacterium]
MIHALNLVSLLLLLLPAPLLAEFPTPHNSEQKPGEPPSPQDSLAAFHLPENFHADLFAAEPEVRNPIALAWDPRGRLWIAENFTYAEKGTRFELSLQDRILIFEDTDHDGQADSRTVFSMQHPSVSAGTIVSGRRPG